jgi:hypothetical protein
MTRIVEVRRVLLSAALTVACLLGAATLHPVGAQTDDPDATDGTGMACPHRECVGVLRCTGGLGTTCQVRTGYYCVNRICW